MGLSVGEFRRGDYVGMAFQLLIAATLAPKAIIEVFGTHQSNPQASDATFGAKGGE